MANRAIVAILGLLAVSLISMGLGAYSVAVYSARPIKNQNISRNYGIKTPKINCRSYDAPDNSELCAQWISADAAMRSVTWTEYSFYLSLSGTAGVILTLLIAISSNRIALRAIEDDTRPWIHAVGIACEPLLLLSNDSERALLQAKLILKNTGRTVASNVTVSFHPVSEPSIPFSSWKKPMPTQWADRVVPEEKKEVFLPVILSWNSVGGVFVEQFLAIKISYFAANNRKRRELYQIWSISKSVFMNTPQGLDITIIAEGRAPVATLMFTARMT